MAQHIIGHCPICRDELVATRLLCQNCGLELSKNFSLNKFTYLSEEQLAFVELFLQYNGNIKELQKQLKLSYPAVKKKLETVQISLGLKTETDKQNSHEIIIKQLPMYKDESQTIKMIKQKLNDSGGLATLTLSKGSVFQIYYEEYGNGICSTNIPARRVLFWSAFDNTIMLLKQQKGTAIKGNAMKGKLGSKELPLNSVEGYVAYHTYQIKEGESCPCMIPTLSAILEWANICKNRYGYLELND